MQHQKSLSSLQHNKKNRDRSFLKPSKGNSTLLKIIFLWCTLSFICYSTQEETRQLREVRAQQLRTWLKNLYHSPEHQEGRQTLSADTIWAESTLKLGARICYELMKCRIFVTQNHSLTRFKSLLAHPPRTSRRPGFCGDPVPLRRISPNE